MTDYCTAAEVFAHVGRTPTAAQTAEANALIPAATAWIDQRTGRALPQTGAVTDELHVIDGPLVYLDHAPVSSVSSVKVRPRSVGASDTTLTAGSGYELLDATRGVLRLAAGWPGFPGDEVRVTYTPAVQMDARLQLAAKKLVAFWLRPILDGVSPGIKRYSVGQELTVEYADGAISDGVPAEVLELVENAKPRKVVFA